jgi:hypothetical protein
MITERQLDNWWDTFGKHSLLEFLNGAQQPKPNEVCRPPPPEKLEKVERWLKLDYKGDQVALYGMDFAGRDQILYFKSGRPIDTDSRAWAWFRQKVADEGHDIVLDNQGVAAIRMAKGDGYTEILKAAAWTFSKLGGG